MKQIAWVLVASIMMHFSAQLIQRSSKDFVFITERNTLTLDSEIKYPTFVWANSINYM